MTQRLPVALAVLLTLSLLPGCKAGSGPAPTPPAAVAPSPTSYATPTLPPTWTLHPPTPTYTRVIQPTLTFTPGPSPTPTRLPARTTALVVGIQDSRTIEVLIDGQPMSRTFTVRLLGVEPPLLSDLWSEVAVDWLAKEIKLHVVVLESDEEERDAQGNLLRYVWKGGRMINVTMVQLGLATALEDVTGLNFGDDLLDAQADAQAARRGLWGLPPTATPAPVTATATLTGTQTPTVTLTAMLTVTLATTQMPTTTLAPTSPP